MIGITDNNDCRPRLVAYNRLKRYVGLLAACLETDVAAHYRSFATRTKQAKLYHFFAQIPAFWPYCGLEIAINLRYRLIHSM